MAKSQAQARPDQQTIERLVTEHYAAVYRFCARRAGEDAASDLAQETFLIMQKSYAKFQGKSKPSTWIIGIAQNVVRNHHRKTKIADVPLTDWLDPATPAHDKEICDRQALMQALGKLSPDHREAVLLHEIEGHTYAEIAEILSVPEGTVKSRLHYAFLQLRTQLAGGLQ